MSHCNPSHNLALAHMLSSHRPSDVEIETVKLMALQQIVPCCCLLPDIATVGESLSALVVTEPPAMRSRGCWPPFYMVTLTHKSKSALKTDKLRVMVGTGGTSLILPTVHTVWPESLAGNLFGGPPK